MPCRKVLRLTRSRAETKGTCTCGGGRWSSVVVGQVFRERAKRERPCGGVRAQATPSPLDFEAFGCGGDSMLFQRVYHWRDIACLEARRLWNLSALKQRGIETASGVVTSCLGLYGDGLYIKPPRPQGLRGPERLINSQCRALSRKRRGGTLHCFAGARVLRARLSCKGCEGGATSRGHDSFVVTSSTRGDSLPNSNLFKARKWFGPSGARGV